MTNIVKQPCDEVIRSAPCTTPLRRDFRPWVLAATIIGSSILLITVVNVALPVLQAELNATAAQVQWIVESYALFLAAPILVGGSLGDLYGRRRILPVVSYSLHSPQSGVVFRLM